MMKRQNHGFHLSWFLSTLTANLLENHPSFCDVILLAIVRNVNRTSQYLLLFNFNITQQTKILGPFMGFWTDELLNLRLTIRLISQKTSDTNDYKIFLKFVKDESINEV